MKEDLGFYQYPCLIIVCDKNITEHGDYKELASITAKREVTFECDDISDEAKAKILAMAKKEFTTVCTTSEINWFEVPPSEMKIIKE
jgi:hypothetical protein